MKKIGATVALVNRLVANPEQRAKVFEEIGGKEGEGYSYHGAAASLELLILRLVNGKRLPFTVTEYHVSSRGSMPGQGTAAHISEATVKVVVRGGEFFEVSEGNGPINALDGALRRALRQSFQQLDNLNLVDYSVRLVGGRLGTDSKTSVLIATTNGVDTWWTVGVSRDVVAASLQALVDGLEYALLPKDMKK